MASQDPMNTTLTGTMRLPLHDRTAILGRSVVLTPEGSSSTQRNQENSRRMSLVKNNNFDSMLSKKYDAVKDAQTSPGSGEFRLPSKDSTMTNNVPETALLA